MFWPRLASPPRLAAASSSRRAAATTGRIPIATSTDRPRTGGRPTAAGSAELASRILDAAAGLFLQNGGTWLTGFDAAMEGAPSLEAALLTAGRHMLAVALTPSALALHRLMVAEAGRFPELATALRDSGARVGIERLCHLLGRHCPEASPRHLAFLAEQFQHMVLAGPQARALGLGECLDADALAAWCRDSAALFLRAVPNTTRDAAR